MATSSDPKTSKPYYFQPFPCVSLTFTRRSKFWEIERCLRWPLLRLSTVLLDKNTNHGRNFECAFQCKFHFHPFHFNFYPFTLTDTKAPNWNWSTWKCIFLRVYWPRFGTIGRKPVFDLLAAFECKILVMPVTSHVFPLFSSLSLAEAQDLRLYIAPNRYLERYAVNADNGEFRWQKPRVNLWTRYSL